MLVLFIQLESVRDLEIFIKDERSKRQVERLKHAYTKHLKRLEQCSNRESFEQEAEVRHEIRLYPENGMFEWIEHNQDPCFNVTGVGRASYNSQQMREVLITLYLQKISFIYRVLG